LFQRESREEAERIQPEAKQKKIEFDLNFFAQRGEFEIFGD